MCFLMVGSAIPPAPSPSLGVPFPKLNGKTIRESLCMQSVLFRKDNPPMKPAIEIRTPITLGPMVPGPCEPLAPSESQKPLKDTKSQKALDSDDKAPIKEKQIFPEILVCC